MDIYRYLADIPFLEPIQGQPIIIEYLEFVFDECKLALNMDILCCEKKLALRFENVRKLKIEDVSNRFCISGIQIIDNIKCGWQLDSRYTVEDYENDCLHFYCEDIILRQN